MRVSIVINNYNYREFIRQAVESALQQDYRDVEVIVVDDGSTDNSVEALDQLRSRVTLITKGNGGQGSAYNAGFKQVTGDIVLFLDADDWLYPTAVSEVVTAWSGAVTKVQFRLALVNRAGQASGRYVPRTMNDSDAMSLIRHFAAYGSPPGSGNAFATSFLRKILPLEERQWRTAADTVPILLAPMYGEIVSINKTLGAYRLHKREESDDLLSGNAPDNLWHEFARIAWTKGFVKEHMTRLQLRPCLRFEFAPWESRIVALCIRFGGPAPAGLVASTTKLAVQSVTSVWRWPPWRLTAKLALSAWIMLLYVLPHTAARQLAKKHRAAIGAHHKPAP